MKWILKNGMVVEPSGVSQRDLFVEDGKFVEAFEEADAEIVDAKALHVFPGVIDMHVHFRDPGVPHKETFETGSKAAALGGVTTVFDMPNTNPATLTAEAFESKRALIEGRSYVDFGLHMGAGKDFASLENLEGVRAIKLYMGSSTGELLVEEPNIWERIFRAALERDWVVIVHAEDEKRIRERTRELQSLDGARFYAEARDCECAKLAVSHALELQAKVGNKLHVAHVSCKEEIELLNAVSDERVTYEIAPHHLFFTMDDMKDARLKMNPPLRHPEDQAALWQALQMGARVMIATDHAPHTLDEKKAEIWSAPAGVPGVQFSLPLLLDAANKGRIPLARVAELMASNPARAFQLSHKGSFKPGMDADIVLVDLQKSHTILASDVASKCGWSPYEGMTLKGWPVATYLRGKCIMQDGEVLDATSGRFL